MNVLQRQLEVQKQEAEHFKKEQIAKANTFCEPCANCSPWGPPLWREMHTNAKNATSDTRTYLMNFGTKVPCNNILSIYQPTLF